MNILVIVCDELRHDALECAGNPYVHTPNMNRLAARSVRFENAFTQAPVCSPARHSLASGKYPHAHGVLANGQQPFEGLYTVDQALKPHGYRGLQIGGVPKNGRPGSGFETNDYKPDAKFLSEEVLKLYEWENQSLTRRRTGGPSPRTKEEYKGYQAAKYAIRLITDAVEKGDKFHCWVNFAEPHPPYYPPKEIYARFDQGKFEVPEELPDSAPAPHRSITEKQMEWSHLTHVEKRQIMAGYYGLVELADEYVGMVLDTLDRLGVAGETMIVFTADHGEQLGEHNLYTKFVMREASVRVPLLISLPQLKSGVRSQLIEHVDLFPTLCDYADAPVPAGIHGRSLRTILETGETPADWRTEVFAQIDDHRMIRTEQWKLNEYGGEPGELYNLQEDPREFYNLIEDPRYSGTVQELHKRLRERLS
ncbi:MAG: sulfatase [Paenibacillus sp.]|nr:sulfatase [Paenibacillus sp.]